MLRREGRGFTILNDGTVATFGCEAFAWFSLWRGSGHRVVFYVVYGGS
jgi:hypothetical protein